MKIFVFFGTVSAVLLATFCFVGARGGSAGGGHAGGGHAGGGHAGGGHAGGGHAGGGHTGGGHISGGHSTAAHVVRQAHPQVYHEPSAGIPAVSHPAVRRTPNSQTWRSSTIQHVQSGTQARIRQFAQHHTVAKGMTKGAVMPHHDQVTHVQNAFRGYHSNYQKWFDKGFYERHHLHNAYNNWYGNYWYAPTWGAVSGWFPWGWDSPYYYDYPTDGYSSEYPDVDENQAGDGYSEYVQMAPEQPEINAPSSLPEGQMLPFGVFSVASDVNQAAYSNTVVQLSADKSGQIFGTYYNAAADTTLPITGQIDPQTQQASWAISGQSDSPVMITSTYNLTQDVVPVKMFFEDGSEQNWFYVRITK